MRWYWSLFVVSFRCVQGICARGYTIGYRKCNYIKYKVNTWVIWNRQLNISLDVGVPKNFVNSSHNSNIMKWIAKIWSQQTSKAGKQAYTVRRTDQSKVAINVCIGGHIFIWYAYIDICMCWLERKIERWSRNIFRINDWEQKKRETKNIMNQKRET